MAEPKGVFKCGMVSYAAKHSPAEPAVFYDFPIGSRFATIRHRTERI
ncbi:MAG: hypothetical protein NNA22_06475 [Nitrospira sp.]|nr:hypothetical protein [Nitrospira sp.]